MLNLLTTLMLGAFLIYGLDDLGVISADDFEVIEKANVGSSGFGEGSQEAELKPAVSQGRFTDRIVKLRKERQEG